MIQEFSISPPGRRRWRHWTGAALGIGAAWFSGTVSGCAAPSAALRAAGDNTAAAPQSRPNILLIVCDQLSERAAGLYPPGFVRTPNLDRLLAQSVRFTRGYTVCPLCMPARAAMWTGRYPHENGVVSNLEPLPGSGNPAYPTLGETFSAAGYQTVHFGKQHDAGTLRGFQRVEPGTMRKFTADLPVNYDSFYDVDTTRLTVDFLRREAAFDRPFLAVADLHNPHNICQFVGKNESLPLPDSRLLPPLPDNFQAADWATRPLPVQYLCCTHPRQRQAAHWSPERYRFYLYAYARYLEMADRQVGEILQALEESGRAERTIVVLSADHGEGMAAFGLVTKHLAFYENAVNIPVAIFDPVRRTAARVDRERLVSNLDLYPTLCELAGIGQPAGLRGTSLLCGTGPEYVVSEWVSEYFEAVSPGRMLVDRRYKYVHYREGDGEELYDLQLDPGELRNLAALPEFRPQLAACRARLDAHLARTGDAYRTAPVIVDAAYRKHAPGFRCHVGSDAITEGRELFPERGPGNWRTYTDWMIRCRRETAEQNRMEAK